MTNHQSDAGPRPAAELPAILSHAIAAHQGGDLGRAESLYHVVLRRDARQFDALHMLGVLAGQRRDFAKADRLIRQALNVDPRSFEAHSNHARVLLELREYERALDAADTALSLRPDHVPAHLFRGCALLLLRRLEPALQSFDKTLSLRPDFVPALCNRGEALFELKRYDQALTAYHEALAIQPDYAEALKGVGNVLWALQSFDRALAAYDKALAVNPDLAEAWLGRGNVLHHRKDFDQARLAYAKAFALKPDLKYARGSWLRAKLQVCDWNDLEEECSRLTAVIGAGAHACDPFTLLALPVSPDIQLACARLFVADRVERTEKPLRTFHRRSRDRIRIAYLSADFRDHAVASVIAELLERHDRSRFDVWGVSFATDEPGQSLDRVRAAFDCFHNVRNRTDRDAAELLHQAEIDIAVDLMGHTEHSRPAIFAHRLAPVQVGYLGFPGTTGADFIDYIIADRFVLPFDQQRFFTERIVHLPGSYQPTDSRRKISTHAPKRSEIGLPEEGFVFCCFNSNYKISPPIFDVWMRLLRSIEGSVLWLAVADDPTRENLRREARQRRVDPARLVLTDPVAHEDYLARQVLADLFLDTVPYNAHATGSNALAAGLPLVTCRGTTFAGRVGTSLLHAVGLPELVTESLEAYEALTVKLATDRELLRSIRGKLQANRATCALFNTDRLRLHIETAYETIWERYQRGEPPASFSVTRFD